jgi:hypothetical protein
MWQPIETAPKDGSRIVVLWPDGWADFAVWKTNSRIVLGRELNEQGAVGLSDSYFGDPNENDDYDLAKPENAPTHWMPLPEPPDAN